MTPPNVSAGPPEKDVRPSARASIASVAQRAGVSIATVSRVVNGVEKKVSADIVARVRSAVAELGYRPMSLGQALRRRRSRLVALLAANLANPTMAAIAASAEAALRAAGFVMVLCDTHDRPDLQDEYLLEMQAHLAHGFVLLGAVDSPRLRDFLAAGEPMLFVSRRCPVDGDSPFVGIDNAAAGREVARHIIARDRRPVAVLHGPLSSSATAERVKSFHAEMHAAGVPVVAVPQAGDGGGGHLELGYRGVDALLAMGRPPGAVFCASDLIAFGAHRRALEAGLATPEDILFIGFDDNPLNPWIAPWLSSVSVPYADFGVAIVECLRAMDKGDGQAQRILSHRLVDRG
jgi:LacI family transcriptional regulator